MSINHGDVIEIEKLDVLVLNSAQELVRPYLIVTTNPATKEILDSCISLPPKQSTDPQSDSNPEQ